MVICKFFLQGNCRYGDRCWNEHPQGQGQQNWKQNQNQQFGVRQQLNFGGGNRGQHGGGRGSFQEHNYGQNRFAALANQGGGSQKQAPASVKDMSPQELVELIAQDMAVWDTSNMWPFSCYAVGKEAPCLPGFSDLSPEELRLEAYQTQAAGTFTGYQQKMAQMSNEYKVKRKELKQPNPEMKQRMLQELMNQKINQAPGGASVGVSGTSVFGGSTGGSVFGGASGSPSGTYGGVTPNVNPFAANPSAASSNQGLFGANQTSQTQFGSQGPKPSVFGSQPNVSSSGIFGGAAGAGSGAFGSQGQQALFTGGASVAPSTGNTASVGLFGKPAAQTGTTGLFGKPAAQPSIGTGLFGKPAQPAGNTSSVFGNQSVFGQSNANQVAPSPGMVTNPGTFGNFSSGLSQQTSLAGGAVNSPQSAQTGNPSAPSQEKSAVYTPLDQLTADEKKHFEAATFTLGNIPTRPPPFELCK